MTHVAQAPRRYFIELMSAMALYFITIFGRRYGAEAISDPVLKDLIIASPILPVVLAAVVILRLFYRIDEYLRRQMLEALAIAGAFTCVFSMSWSFLVDIGLPEIHIGWVWPIFAVFWVLTTITVKLRYLAAEGKAVPFVTKALLQLVAILVATATYAFVASKIGWPDSWGVLILVFTGFFLIRFAYTLFTRKDAC